MTDLTCPACGLRVPLATRNATAGFDDCPRCLARTGGAVSVRLAAEPAGDDAQGPRAVTSALRRLLPGAVRR
jgi:hypothetical protein